MQKIVLFFIVFNCFGAMAQDIYALDKENGFRGVHFGDSIALYPKLKAFEQSKDSQYTFYRKTDEDFQIGGGKVDIVYTFYKGELATVYIKTADSLSSRKVLKVLQASYGKGKQENLYIEKYNWWGREVTMSFNEDINKFVATIFISSIKMKLKIEGRDKY